MRKVKLSEIRRHDINLLSWDTESEFFNQEGDLMNMNEFMTIQGLFAWNDVDYNYWYAVADGDYVYISEIPYDGIEDNPTDKQIYDLCKEIGPYKALEFFEL